jgi:hypothetical protein
VGVFVEVLVGVCDTVVEHVVVAVGVLEGVCVLVGVLEGVCVGVGVHVGVCVGMMGFELKLLVCML